MITDPQRRRFEILLSEEADRQDMDKKSFRSGFKYCLITLKHIEGSTNELGKERMSRVIDRLVELSPHA